MRLGFVALLAAIAGCADHSLPITAQPRSDEAAIALIERRCTVCHGTDRIFQSVGTPDEWMALVHRMAYHHKGKLIAHLTDDDAMAIARWLGQNQTPAQEGARIGFQPTGRPL